MTKLPLALGLALLLQVVQALAVSSGDENYFYREYENFDLIFSENDRALADAIDRPIRFFHELYEKEFGWTLDEHHALVLASPRNQIANAMVTPLPSLTGILFGGGAEKVDYFAAESWVQLLLAHEITHMYQLNVKSGVPSAMKSVLGNTNISFKFPLSYWVYPSVFAPTLLLEGFATYNESRFGMGGRLYSGESRALLISLIQAGRINAKMLINDHLSFPYGTEKYIVGAHFAAFLAEKFGDEKVNSVFAKHAEHYINPLLLNKTFIETFGVSFDALVQQFFAYWDAQAKESQRAKEPTLAISSGHVPFTTSATGNHFTMIAPERDTTTLVKITPDGRVSQATTSLLPGRVFHHKGQFHTAVSSPVSPTELAYGLFNDNGFIAKGTKGRYVYDLRGKNVLYAEVSKSFLAPRLYWNKKDLGYVASSALFNDAEVPVYFRQKDGRRVLVVGTDEVYSYQGYYGFPVGAQNGEVYFIAPSRWGSSLFKWSKDRGVNRAHLSDFIVDARILEGGKVAIYEINARGYELKVSQLGAIEDRPYLYPFSFRQMRITNGKPKKPVPTKPYNSITALKFDGIDPELGVKNGDVTGRLGVRFSDPLGFNQIEAYGLIDSYDSDGYGIRYDNRRYRLNWGLAALYEEDPFVKNDKLLFHDEESTVGIYFRYPFLLSARHGLDYLITVEYEHDKLGHANPAIKVEDYELNHFFDYKYVKRQKYLTHSPTRSVQFSIGQESLAEAPKWRRYGDIFGASLSVSQDILRDTSLGLMYQAVRTEAPNGLIEFEDRAPIALTPTDVQRSTEDPINGVYYELRRFGASLTQGFMTEIYSSIFPIGLRRTVAYAFYNEFYGSFERDDSVETLGHEIGTGMMFEVLFAHRLAVLIGFEGATRGDEKDDDDMYRFTLRSSF